jgi:MFS family permease
MGGFGMALLAPAAFTSNPFALGALFGFSTFAYSAFGTMILVLPSDLFPGHSVATVSGMSGTGAGIGTIISTFLIGFIADHYSFEPILIAASLIPFTAMIFMLFTIRNTKATSKGLRPTGVSRLIIRVPFRSTFGPLIEDRAHERLAGTISERAGVRGIQKERNPAAECGT